MRLKDKALEHVQKLKELIGMRRMSDVNDDLVRMTIERNGQICSRLISLAKSFTRCKT